MTFGNVELIKILKSRFRSATVAAGERRGSILQRFWEICASLAVLASWVGSTPVSAASLVATVGKPAPAFVIEDLRGAALSSRMLRGRPLYINVFATWCPPCRIELPEIVRSYDRFKGKVTFLGVDEQEPAGKIELFTRAMGIRYTIGIDQGQMEASFRAHSVPTSIFIDRHGIVRALYRGPIPDSLLRKNLALIAAS